MPIPLFRCQRFISQSLTAACIAALFAGSTLVAQGQATEPREKNGDQQPSIKLHVAGNLVVVRVLVRDTHGAPVENLRKEDFRVYDNGKEQSIAQFEARAASKSDQLPPSPAQASSTVEPSQSPVMPATFLALYFDDLSMADTEVVYARDATDRYLRVNLQSAERVAIFTASGEPQSDFTDNLKKLNDVLFDLRSSLRRNNLQGCPKSAPIAPSGRRVGRPFVTALQRPSQTTQPPRNQAILVLAKTNQRPYRSCCLWPEEL
jgi:VWFA-related protein